MKSRVVPAPEAPEAPKIEQPSAPSCADLELLEGSEVKLCLPSALSTLLSSIIMSALSTVGLLAFGMSELGLPLPRPAWLTLGLRLLGWIALFVFPVLLYGVPLVRGFLFWGIRPGLSFWSHSERRKDLPRVVPILQHFITLAVFTTLTFLPLHRGQSFGFFMVFALGSAFSIPGASLVARTAGPPLLGQHYVNAMAPRCFFMPVLGFGVLVSGYVALRQVAGSWLSTFMPLLLSVYEFLGTMYTTLAFTREFVTKPDMRELYADTNQGITLSVAICSFHAMAEGARLTLLYIDNLQSQTLDFLLPILSSVVWNVLVRLGCMDRFVSIVSRSRIKPQNATKLLRDAGYCMGYPRFGAVAALLIARRCLQNSAVLSEMEGRLWMCLLGGEVLEDLLGYSLWRAGVDFSPIKRFATDEEVQVMSEKTLARLQFSSGAASPREHAVVPAFSRKSSAGSEPGEAVKRLDSVESVKWEVRVAHDFKYGPAEFGLLPFWAHFLPVAFSQFHTILAVMVLSKSIVYILGFCEQAESSSILWWTIPGVEGCA